MAGSRIPRIETIIITVFFLGVAVWAIDRCTSRRTEVVKRIQEFAAKDDAEDRPETSDTTMPTLSNKAPVKAAPLQEQPQQPSTEPADAPTGSIPALPGKKTAPATPAKQEPAASTSSGSILYVTIDGLKMRKEPGLKGEPVAKLKLYEPVTFLDKKTDWTQEISLGYEKVTDHWVKVRTKSGEEGWVFGAGVHYYKMKRKGVLE